MTRTFTIELDEDEVATVWRLAELTGVPAAQIVRRMHRTHPGFIHAKDLTKGDEVYEWSEGHKVLVKDEEREQLFRSLAWAVVGNQR